MGLFAWIGKGILGTLKLIALPFAKLGTPRVRPYVRWTLHVLAVGIIFGCLAWLNRELRLDQVVRASSPLLRALWLPLLFAAIYTLAWLAWWLWHVATSPSERSPFPDVDDAWRDALAALEEARIDPLKTPIYLLVGGVAERMQGIVESTGWTWDVPLTPRRASAPVRVCATQEAIFVDLSKSCAASAYIARLSERPAHETPGATIPEVAVVAESSGGTAVATATRRTAQRGLELIEQSLALLETEQREQQEHETHLDGVQVAAEELILAGEKLAHVCHLLAELRTPYCPANGVVALVPWEVTATTATTNRAAVLLDRDLQTISDTLRIAAPTLAIVSDIDLAPGGAELVSRIPPDQRQRRFGIRLPRLAAADAAAWPRVAQEGVEWLSRELLPALIYRVLRAGQNVAEQDLWRGNAQVFRLLAAMREREARLARIITRGVLPALRGAPLAGIFFSANGSDDPNRRAFLPGVLPQLLEMQNEVAWLQEAVVSDAKSRRWTRWGYALLAAILSGLIAVCVAQA